MFDNAEIEIPCPKCSVKAKKTIAWVKANDSLTCSGCDETIHVDKSGLIDGLQQVDRGIDGFRRKLKSMSLRR